MLSEGMYVRCPADPESTADPRMFLCGQVVGIDRFAKTITVEVYDPFSYGQLFEYVQQASRTLPMRAAVHCSLFVGTAVMVGDEMCTILSARRAQDDFYLYDVQTEAKAVLRVSERDIIAPFTNGQVDPTVQLRRYEFQNPCWFMGRAVVSKSMNLLENAIYGFKELAGCKIYLLPHQVNTIMRCLQERPCRFMLADEVGMGKTVEALSVLTVYMTHNAGKNILVLVPDMLKEQWKGEMLLKFNLSEGLVRDDHLVCVRAMAELDGTDENRHWDFVIVDEVHRYLSDRAAYALLHRLSGAAENVLLLSATPVQQRREEYLELLRLLQPHKYDAYDLERFSELIRRQEVIIQKTVKILDDLKDYEETADELRAEGEDPHASDDLAELFADIVGALAAICKTLKDDKLSVRISGIDFDSDDLGIYAMKVVISYLCGNYQIESNIIRSRRELLAVREDGTRLLPVRAMQDVPYALDKDRNTYEARAYECLAEWLAAHASELDMECVVRPLLETFFSSAQAFCAQLDRMSDIDEELRTCAAQWRQTEEYICTQLTEILDDPDSYAAECCSRLATVMNLLYDELYNQKVVLFTNHAATFAVYQTALAHVFSPEEISFFGARMEPAEIELHSYRFQNEDGCRILLCDYTGGEGRNFQCADALIHIDLPWDVNRIEQRIGRLDRLERDPARPIVTSIVVHTEDSFEDALFRFWNEGLRIFTCSLSGMEIIMKDINEDLRSAVREDFQYGLSARIPQMIARAESMRAAVRKEQHYDAAALLLRPMYNELRRLVDYYAENENELFAATMMNWASLAGFHGYRDAAETISYAAEAFSPKAAMNAQLIPPQWDAYLNSERSRRLLDVQEAYRASRNMRSQRRLIRGTFRRKQAIENDYLHFFAPGDEVFDCIVQSALNSCKGRSAAFAALSTQGWKGLIFTWRLMPDDGCLLSQGLSTYELGAYRSYLMAEQVVIPVSIENADDLTDAEVVREYAQIIHAGFRREKIVHLGKRGRTPAYLADEIKDQRNIDYFRAEYPAHIWRELVVEARRTARDKAEAQFLRRSNFKGAREEMERMLSAREARCAFYGDADDRIAELRKAHEVLLEAMHKSRIVLDAAAFVWMVKTDGQREA